MADEMTTSADEGIVALITSVGQGRNVSEGTHKFSFFDFWHSVSDRKAHFAQYYLAAQYAIRQSKPHPFTSPTTLRDSSYYGAAGLRNFQRIDKVGTEMLVVSLCISAISLMCQCCRNEDLLTTPSTWRTTTSNPERCVL